ncbi:hypothetical protein GJ496_002527 [Pomphorhynchus laevis]|nr:hypothetical protein GJ496_002527 [Pomphorhynchus laevis]
MKVPFIDRQISKKRLELKKKFKKERDSKVADLPTFKELPELPLNVEEINDLIKSHAKTDICKWQDGCASGCIYTVDNDISTILKQVAESFEHGNPLHVDLFPGLLKMEAEVTHMVSKLFNGNDETVGTVTSGGSESLILAVKTYREYYRKTASINPIDICLVAPESIHPAVIKACHYFNIRPILVKVNSTTKKVESTSLYNALNNRTCAIFLSAPNYSYGVVDPVEELCKLLRNSKFCSVPVHVDACLGSFVVPFLNHLEVFDFRLPEVTSISCDTHKYGLAAKGTSVVVYRNSNIAENQVFAYGSWSGGIYATPNISGSRSGLLIAACWATMLRIGRQQYGKKALELYAVSKELANGLENIGFTLLAEVETCVVSATCDHCHAYLDQMKSLGWYLATLQDPIGFHIVLTELHLQKGVIQKFLSDSVNAMEIANSHNNNIPLSDMAVLYGTNAMLPDRSITEDIAKDYIISFYEH